MFCRYLEMRSLAAVFAALLMVALFSPAVGANAPEDIADHWAEDEIEDWLMKGWISGYEDGTFRPDKEVSRAEFVVLVGRSYELPHTRRVPGFDDVEKDDWYYQYVADAVNAEIIKGRDEDTFAPADNITRQEAAVIVDRLLDLEPIEEPPPFFDQEDIAGWAEDAVTRAAGAEIITGYDDGTFGPTEPITRAETVVVLNRGLKIREMLPVQIKEWVDYSREIMCAQAREFEDSLYLLVTYGEQPTGGYHVEITDVTEGEDQLEVTVEFTEPEEGEPVTQAITYPYDMKEIEPTDLPVKFIAEGDMSVVPTLSGLDWLPPMVAGEDDIRVFSPAPGDEVAREFTVEAIELVFEGTVHYRLLDDEGQELDSGMTGGHAYDWGYFELDFSVPDEVEYGEEISAQLYSESPVDGSIINLVELDLVIVEDEAALTDAQTSMFYCEKYESFEFEVTLQGLLPEDEGIRIDFSEAAEHGIIFEGDIDDVAVEPRGDISFEPTVPPGLPVIIYQPHQQLPDGSTVEFEVDPGNDSPPGYYLGCEDEDAWREAPHELIFERTDSGYTTAAEMEVAGPQLGRFEVINEEGEPLEDANVLVNGEEGVTDSEGIASFELVPRDYDYRVEKPGYQAATDGLQIDLQEWSEEVVLLKEGPAAVLTLDEEEYFPEDDVHITLENTGTTELHLGDHSFPFSVERYEDGRWTEVDTAVPGLWVEVNLEPGETHESLFSPQSDFIDDVEPGRYRVVNETECLETGEQLFLSEEFEVVLPVGVPDPEKSEFEPASIEIEPGEVADIHVTVRDAYGAPVPIGTDDDDISVSLTAPDGSNPVGYYNWMSRCAMFYRYGDDHQLRIEIEAHDSNTGSADDLMIWADDVVLTDQYQITVEPSLHTVTFSETQGLQGVKVQVCEDEDCSEEVGESVKTDEFGTAQKDLGDGDYWFTAYGDGYLDHRDDFTVAGGDITEYFELIRPAALIEEDPVFVELGWMRCAVRAEVHEDVQVGEFAAHMVVELSGRYEGVPQFWDSDEEKWVDFEEIGDGLYMYGPQEGFELTALDGVRGEFRVESSDEDLHAAFYLHDADEPGVQLTDRLEIN